MNLMTEFKKIKRTGLAETFLAGGILSALVPVLNTALRTEMFVGQQGNPFEILINGNWQIIAMLNVLLVVVGSSIIYNIEYSNNAVQKTETLPINSFSVFLGKFTILSIFSILNIALETISLVFCVKKWFDERQFESTEVLKFFGISVLFTFTAVFLMMLVAKYCKNMWVCLGTGVLFVLFATVLGNENLYFSMFPFALPFETIFGNSDKEMLQLIVASVSECGIFIVAELILNKIRRNVQ